MLDDTNRARPARLHAVAIGMGALLLLALAPRLVGADTPPNCNEAQAPSCNCLQDYYCCSLDGACSTDATPVGACISNTAEYCAMPPAPMPYPTPLPTNVACPNPPGGYDYPLVEAPASEHDAFLLAAIPPQPDLDNPDRLRCSLADAQQRKGAQHVLPLANHWRISLPWGPKRAVHFDAPASDGWAIDVRNPYGCELDGWCPYACEPGFIETQFDDYVGQPYHLSTQGDGWVGAGRRIATIAPGDTECTGGKIGLYCNAAGEARVKAPSKRATHGVAYGVDGFSRGYRRKLCRRTPGVTLVNTAGAEVTACRTVFPGTEIPQIPTKVSGGNGTQPLTILPDDGRWWKAGVLDLFGTLSTAPIEYFVGRLAEPNRPVCVWDTVRPSCAPNPLSPGAIPPSCSFPAGPNGGGVDFYPYIIEVQRGVGNLVINTNNDYTANWFGVYDPALGHPGYGIAAYDGMGTLLGAVEWCGGYKRALRRPGKPLACSKSDQNTDGLLCGYDTSNSVATDCGGKGFASDPVDASCRAVYDTTKLAPRTWNVGSSTWSAPCTYDTGTQTWSASCTTLADGAAVTGAATVVFYPLALPHQCSSPSAPPPAPPI
ncbi:hypothetical protein K2Z84_32685 [Candidatus Binatia bacterium]|nr:hypothetical protein [Candidatus Binatia bacterium]